MLNKFHPFMRKCVARMRAVRVGLCLCRECLEIQEKHLENLRWRTSAQCVLPYPLAFASVSSAWREISICPGMLWLINSILFVRICNAGRLVHHLAVGFCRMAAHERTTRRTQNVPNNYLWLSYLGFGLTLGPALFRIWLCRLSSFALYLG